MTASLSAARTGILNADASWELLRSETAGRLAVVAADGVDVFPVNYLVDRGTILFRSAPGTKLLDIAHEPTVAFEVDGVDHRHRWSVVVRGDARRLDADDEIERSGVLGLPTLTPLPTHNYVRITPRVVTGRRFRWEGLA
jgi:uncharacterized protein